MRIWGLFPAVLLAAALLPGTALASTGSEPDLCRAAAVEAARRHGVPEDIMLAITLVETRRRTDGVAGPWPWTVNIAGEGFWFDTRRAALAKAEAALAGGQRSFDVGCFQLNFRWHGAGFPSIDAMFEPALAADYAARFLHDLFAESGDWMRAAGHYHSRTPDHSARYRRMVAAALESDAMAGGAYTAPSFAEPAAPASRRGAGPLLASAAGPLIPLRRSGGATGSAGGIGLSSLTSGRPLAPLIR